MTAQGLSIAPSHWNDLTEHYDPVMSSDPAYRRLLLMALSVIPSDARQILDLGCGTGALTFLCASAFPNATVIGLDPAPRMVEQARRKNEHSTRLSFCEGTASDLSEFKEERFDAVVSNFALHHLQHTDKKKCATEVFRVLKQGGRFINADQHCRIMGERHDPKRILHILDLLTAKARYYFLNAGLDRMILQLELLPRFIKEDGEILATPEFWCEALREAGFGKVNVEVIEPAELINRVIWGEKEAAKRE